MAWFVVSWRLLSSPTALHLLRVTLGSGPPVETCQVKCFYVACSSILSLYHQSVVVVNFEYWKAISSPWGVRVNEWERMCSLWGIRTPEHMKVCARPLKHCWFEWSTFQFIRFPVYHQKLSYNSLDSILRYHNRLFQNIYKITGIGQSPRQNHVCV